jgi:prepilin-type N-terminal cleavage/methylation domain-containing protein
MILKNNSKGFSLIEVIVAMGIMGVFIMGFMRLSEKMVETEMKMMDFIEMNEYIGRVRYILNDSVACNKTLIKNSSVVNKKRILPDELTQIVDRRGKTISTIGNNLGSHITVKSIKIEIESKGIASPIEDPYFLNLFFRIEGRSKNTYGKMFKLTIPVLLEENNNKWEIISCDSMNSGVAQELINSLMKRTCGSLGIDYDPTTGECKLTSDGAAIKNLLNKDMLEKVQRMMEKLNE